MKDYIRKGSECVGDDYKVGFGRYKGNTLENVPSSYLMWLIDQDWFINYCNIAKYILVNQKAIEEDIEE